MELRKTPNPASDFEYELNQAGDGVIIREYIGEDEEVVIPAEIEGFAVTELGRESFAESGVTSVMIPDSVIKMGNRVFSCSDIYPYFDVYPALQKVVLPKNLTEIPTLAFEGCTNLTSIQLPNVTTIGDWAFYGCTSLTSIQLPNVETIEYRAFYDCKSLTFVQLSNVTKIGGEAFYHCKSLTSIQLPNVTEIGGQAFEGCSKLPLAIQKKLRDLGYKGKFKEE